VEISFVVVLEHPLLEELCITALILSDELLITLGYFDFFKKIYHKKIIFDCYAWLLLFLNYFF